MTAIALTPFAKTNSTPFCDAIYKGVKGVQVFCQSLGRNLYSLGLQIVSVACRIFRRDLLFCQFLGRNLYSLGLQIVSVPCRIFNRDLSQICLSIASLQSKRASQELATYSRFGENLIDFSYNGCVIASSSDTEENALRARYGSNTIDRWLQVGTEEIPLKREELKRPEKGLCFAMSLDFIKKYLQQIQLGVSPMEAVREISSRYVAGAPDEAQVAQTFYKALDTTPIRQREFPRLNREIAFIGRQYLQEVALNSVEFIQRLREEYPDWELNDMRAKRRNMERLVNQFILQYNNLEYFTNEDDFTDQVNKIEAIRENVDPRFRQLFNESTTNYKRRFHPNVLKTQLNGRAQIELQLDKIVADQFGLQIGRPLNYFTLEPMSSEQNAKFNQFLQDLPNGSYCLKSDGPKVRPGSPRRPGHAVTLIKSSDNHYFLFDPNFGTFVFGGNEIAEKLWENIRSIYVKNGLCNLVFSPCSLG